MDVDPAELERVKAALMNDAVIMREHRLINMLAFFRLLGLVAAVIAVIWGVSNDSDSVLMLGIFGGGVSVFVLSIFQTLARARQKMRLIDLGFDLPG